jgi:hypothetical protein
MNRPLGDMRLAVMMLDGIELRGRTNIVALGISTEGDKVALGLWDGSTENATVTAALLADLVDRGLDVEQGLLFVIDGSKALRKAIRQVFGNDVPVQLPRPCPHRNRDRTRPHPPTQRRPQRAHHRPHYVTMTPGIAVTKIPRRTGQPPAAVVRGDVDPVSPYGRRAAGRGTPTAVARRWQAEAGLA